MNDFLRDVRHLHNVPWPTLILFGFACIIFLYILRLIHLRLTHNAFIKQHECQPPTWPVPLRDPLFGLDLLMTIVHAFKEHRYFEYNVQRFRALGSTHVAQHLLIQNKIYTIDPENVQVMLAKDFAKWTYPSIRINAMAPLFGHGIFAAVGPRWQHSRALLKPTFTRQNMQPLLNMVERHFQALLRLVPTSSIMRNSDETPPFDLQELFYGLTMDTATEFLLGSSTHVLDEARSSAAAKQFVEDYTACCVRSVKLILLGVFQRFFLFSPTTIRARDRAWSYIDAFVAHALDTSSDKKQMKRQADGEGKEVEYTFLRELGKETQDHARIREEVLNILLAGRDTTAALLSNLFFELACAPELWARLRAEVRAHLPGGERPTERQLKEMKFLKWCINESLRLHPVVPTNTREATQDTTLPVGGGVDGRSPLFVAKGTCVFYNVFAMHRRPDIYGADTDKFIPDRWDGLRPGFGFLPFSAGARICLGQQFALTEASYVIVRLAQTFETITSCDTRPWTEHYTLVASSLHGVQVSVKRDASAVSA